MEDARFNLVVMPLVTTLMYLYQVNRDNGNIISSIVFLTIPDVIVITIGLFIIMDMRDFDNMNKKEKRINTIGLMFVILSIGGSLYLLYPLIRTLLF